MRKTGTQGEKGTGRRAIWIVLAILGITAFSAEAADAAAPQITGLTVSEVTSTTATLKAMVNPGGQKTNYHFEYGTADCSLKPDPCTSLPEVKLEAGATPVPAEALLKELAPGTVYHFALEAKNLEGKARTADRVFATSGAPSEGLPDDRAYEQASPVDKDGGDVVGALGLVKAADDGKGITFGSTFGIPGGKGAQALPSYLAQRGEGEAGWSTQGLLPPAEFGERAQVLGWLPDFSETVSNASRLGNPRTKALILQSTSGAPAEIIAPYTAHAEYSYVGANSDASELFFESEAKLKTEEGGPLIEGAAQGSPNLYVWDRASGELGLAGALNEKAAGEEGGKAPPKGAIAGPYDWSRGISGLSLGEGGSSLNYYLQGTHAITSSGDVYFTEAGTGQLYLRENPTQPQSAMEGEKCKEPAKACTIHVSASKRTVPDPAGSQPAAFQAASADGSKVFFTSPEKLTDESNTGLDQPEAAIGEGNSTTGAIENPALVKKHAVGVAVSGSHLYWADPATGTIDRSGLDGSNFESLIAPGSSECEVELEVEKNVFAVKKVEIPSTPRYVAVDPSEKYVYWTNTGLRDSEGEPIDGGGTIGRAELDGSGNVVKVEPAFICGELEPSPGVREAAVSNPQGIAVNTEYVYWANAATDQNNIERSVARVKASGDTVEAKFLALKTLNDIPYGIALSASHVYVGFNEPGPDTSYIESATLEEGTESVEFFVGKAGIRGLAVDAGNLYWANQGEGAIGRVPLTDFTLGSCEAVLTCEKAFIKPTGTLNGLAADASHLYWSVNGEAPTNPGNDLYRYEPGTNTLEDLSFESGGNGAEVQGVLGASEDGTYLYFAANGALGTGAVKGTCQSAHLHGSITPTSGSCNVYLLHAGTISLVGRVRGTDAQDWTGTPFHLFSIFAPKTAFLSEDGETLLFRSQEKLTGYENEGAPELYRYSAASGKTACVSCPPSGEAVGKGPALGAETYPGPLAPARGSVNMTASRNLSADGNRVFFETAEALVPGDTNGQVKCPGIGPELTPSCTDTYEWEAPETGSCEAGGPGYSALNEGCIFLISTGKSEYPSVFADASESGDDVFFFTRQQLVGQDKDELQDVYDAKVKGGLAAQSEVKPPPCDSVEACHGPAQSPAPEAGPSTPIFVGPGDPVPKHKKSKKKKGKKKSKGKNKSKKTGKKGKQKRAKTDGGQGR